MDSLLARRELWFIAAECSAAIFALEESFMAEVGESRVWIYSVRSLRPHLEHCQTLISPPPPTPPLQESHCARVTTLPGKFISNYRLHHTSAEIWGLESHSAEIFLYGTLRIYKNLIIADSIHLIYLLIGFWVIKSHFSFV